MTKMTKSNNEIIADKRIEELEIGMDDCLLLIKFYKNKCDEMTKYMEDNNLKELEHFKEIYGNAWAMEWYYKIKIESISMANKSKYV